MDQALVNKILFETIPEAGKILVQEGITNKEMVDLRIIEYGVDQFGYYSDGVLIRRVKCSTVNPDN